MSPLLPTSCRISLFPCHASHINLAELAVIWTHDRDVRGMGLFLILRHKLLCIPVFKAILHRPNRLAQCSTQFKSPRVKIPCVLLYLHYNVTFTFE